jgi:hypothetical protein
MKAVEKKDEALRNFRKFEEFTRRLIAVPRAELERELVQYERRKKQRQSPAGRMQPG